MDDDSRLPPNNLDAERAVLGCVLVDSSVFPNLLLEAKDFFRVAHQKIWLSVEALVKEGTPADIVTVSSWLQDKGWLEQVGGRGYVTDLSLDVATTANVLYYARDLKTISRARQAQALLRQYEQKLAEQATTVDTVLSEAQDELRKLASGDSQVMTCAALTVQVLETIAIRCENPGVLTGIPSGYKPIDDIQMGFHPGRVYILGGRSGMGKTTFALNLIETVLTHYDESVMFYSLEMNREEVTEKLLTMMANVKQEEVQLGRLDTYGWQALHEAQARLLDSAPFYVADSTNQVFTVAGVRRELLAKQAAGQMPGLVVIDHLHIMVEDESTPYMQQLGEITRKLKTTAQEFKVPIVLLCQLSREAMKGDGRPTMAHLRECGRIEENVDGVWLIHRPEKIKGNEHRAGDVEIIIAKHRFGKERVCDLRFNEDTGRIICYDTGRAEYKRITEADRRQLPRLIDVEYTIDDTSGTRAYVHKSGLRKLVWSDAQCKEKIQTISLRDEQEQEEFWARLENETEKQPDDMHRAWWRDCLRKMQFARVIHRQPDRVLSNIFDTY